MTIREVISKRRLRILFIVLSIGIPIVLIIDSIYQSKGDFLCMLLILCGIVLFSLNKFIKCPVCDEKLGSLLFKGRSLIEISPKVTCCPKCGVSFDSKINSDLK